MKKHSFGRIFIIAVGVVIVIALLGFIALRMMFPPEKLKSIATTEVGKVLGRPIEIGKAGISVYPFIGFSLSGIELANTARPGFSEEPFVQLDRFLLQVSLTSLFKKQPKITKIVLKKPLIRIEIDSNGAYNFDDLAVISKDTVKAPSEKKQGMPVLPVPVSLQLFAIEDGRFIYHDARSQQHLIIDDIDDTIMFSIDQDLKNITTSGGLSLSRMSLKTKELVKPLSNLVVTLHHDIGADLQYGTIRIKELGLSLQKVVLNLTGTITNIHTTPTLDCSLASETISMSDLIKEIPVELAPILKQIKAAGELTLGLELKGAVAEGEPLPVKGTVSIKDGNLHYAQLPESVNQIQMQCAFTENSLDVTFLKLRFGNNPIELKAKVDNFKKPNVDVKLLADMNLDDAKNLAELPKGSSLSGKVKADIQAKGLVDPSDLSKMSVQGKISINKTRVMWPPLVKPATINGNISITSQSIKNILSLSIGRSGVSLNAHIKNYLSFVFPDSTKKQPRPNVAFTITSPTLDVDEFLPPQEKSSDAKPEKKGSAGPLIAPLPGVDVHGNIKAKRVVFNKIPMNNVTITVNVVNDVADIAVKTGFAGGRIAENLHADLRSGNIVTFNNALSIKNVEVSDVMANIGSFLSPTTPINRELVNLPKSLSGKINVSSNFKGSGGTVDELVNTLKGDVGLKVAKGTITNALIVNRLSGAVEKFIQMKNKNIQFRNLKTSLHIADKSVFVDDLKCLSDAGDWNVSGNVGFDTKLALDISNRLPKTVSRKLLHAQSSVKNSLKGLLQGTQLSQAANLIDNANVGIPADKDSRVTMLFSITGMANDPKTRFTGFGKGVATPQKKQNKTVVAEKIEQTKKDAQRRVEEEKKKAKKRIQEEAKVQKKVIQEKKEQAEEKLKKAAKSRLKKLF